METNSARPLTVRPSGVGVPGRLPSVSQSQWALKWTRAHAILGLRARADAGDGLAALRLAELPLSLIGRLREHLGGES